jgi:hypothetical protein
MSAVRATALRAGGACVRCRKGKTKCVYENGRAPCKNCSKGMHECYLPSESMSHGGHGVSPARTARARETVPSERASGAATGDRHGSAHPTTVVSRNSAPATEKYVLYFLLRVYLCLCFTTVTFAYPPICPLSFPAWSHVDASGSHPLRRIRRRRRLCHDCLRKPLLLPRFVQLNPAQPSSAQPNSARLGSSPSRWPRCERAAPHHLQRHATQGRLSCIPFTTTLCDMHNICRGPRDPDEPCRGGLA